MSETNTEFQLLAKYADPVGTRHSLWLAGDHLLSVINENYCENYKRFYLKDIQALLIHRTSAGMLLNIVFACGAALFLALFGSAMLDNWSLVAKLIHASIAVLFIIALLSNWLRGPTCACYVKTAVQTDCLYAIHRFRSGMRIIMSLKNSIEQIQGVIAVQELQNYAPHLPDPQNAPTIPHQPSQARAFSIVARKHYGGTAHVILFSLLFVGVLHTSCYFFVRDNALMKSVGTAITLLILAVNAFALAKQHNSDLPKSIRAMTWATLVFSVAILFASLAIGFVGALTGHLQAKTQLSPYDYTPLLILSIVDVIWGVALGLSGLLVTLRFRARSAIPPPTPAVSEQVAVAEKEVESTE